MMERSIQLINIAYFTFSMTDMHYLIILNNLGLFSEHFIIFVV